MSENDIITNLLQERKELANSYRTAYTNVIKERDMAISNIQQYESKQTEYERQIKDLNYRLQKKIDNEEKILLQNQTFEEKVEWYQLELRRTQEMFISMKESMVRNVESELMHKEDIPVTKLIISKANQSTKLKMAGRKQKNMAQQVWKPKEHEWDDSPPPKTKSIFKEKEKEKTISTSPSFVLEAKKKKKATTLAMVNKKILLKNSGILKSNNGSRNVSIVKIKTSSSFKRKKYEDTRKKKDNNNKSKQTSTLKQQREVPYLKKSSKDLFFPTPANLLHISQQTQDLIAKNTERKKRFAAQKIECNVSDVAMRKRFDRLLE